MSSVQEISSADELAALSDAWEQLQVRTAPDNVFLTFDWAMAWWRQLGEGLRLRVLVLRDGGGVSGIVPLCEGPFGSRWAPFRRLQLLGTGLSDRLDFLVAENPQGVVERALVHLLEEPSRWDVLDLREIPEGSPTIDAIGIAAPRLGLECDVAPDSECPYLPIDSDWETFCASRFGKDFRRQSRRKARRLEESALPAFSIVDAIPPGSPTLDRLAAVKQDEEYRGEERRSIFGSEAKRAFFADVAERFSRRGWLNLGVLDLGGQPAAFRFAFQYAGKYFDYYSGFDRDFAAMAPGAALLHHVMQDCFQRRLREVDFLRGTEPWKAAWTERRRRQTRIRVFRPGLRGSAVRLLLSANDRLRERPPDPVDDPGGADG